MTGIMIQTAFLVSAILIIRKLLGERLHAYVRYGLWLVVVLRLAMPVNLIQSPFSLLRAVDRVSAWHIHTQEQRSDGGNITGTGVAELIDGRAAEGKASSQEIDAGMPGRGYEPATGDTAGDEVPYLQNDEQNAGQDDPVVQLKKEAYAEQADTEHSGAVGGGTDGHSSDGRLAAGQLPWSAGRIVTAVWIAGSLLTGGMIALSYLRFRRRLYRTRKTYRGDYMSLLPQGDMPVYLVKGLESPCLVGLVRPAIYVGTELPADADSFRYAVIHEQVHFLHGDHLWALLRMALVSVYWFHPFVWLAAAVSIRDGEIACDYGVLRRIGQQERFAYSEMLLAFSHTKGKGVYSYGTMLRPRQSELKERILRLTGTKHSRVWAGALSVACMIVIAGCALTGAAPEDGEGQDSATAQTTDAATENAGKQTGTEATLADRAGITASQNGDNGDQNAITSQDRDNGGESAAASQNGDAIGEGSASRDGEADAEDIPRKPQQIEVVTAVLSEETMFGVDGPTLDYAGPLGTEKENVIIFHDYFGLVVYDLTNREVVRALNLEQIGCHMTQGDDACEIAVAADGTTVWLHPRSKRYRYRYNVQENTLWQEPLIKTFDIDLEGEELFDRYLTTEETTQGWHSNYLYEEYQDERGTWNAYIYLTIPDGAEPKLGSLECTWDDMVFILEWNAPSGTDAQADADVGFPYYYDGVVNEVELIFDKPCDYTRISDTYGSRVHPVTHQVRVHEGIDYVAEEGSDVYAAAGGVVYETGYSSQYGNYVVLLHVNGQMSYYCQCRDILVEKDDRVARGDTIATVGSTGMSTGAHLHFAISSYGTFVDPQEEMWVVQELD